MSLEELKNKLAENNVPERWYSLDDGLKTDACILRKNYNVWEFFYLDEKGDRHDFKAFDTEELAFSFLWEKMKKQLIFFKRQVK